MRTAKTAGAVVAAGLLSAASLSSAQDDIRGKPAFNFSLKDVNGRQTSLKEFKGKVVVLDFWAVWCGPCVRSLPFLQNLQDKYGRDGLVVIGLHVDDRRPPSDEVKEYLTERDVSYTNLISTTEVDENYVVMAMPTTYFVDRDGKVAGRHIGFNPTKAPEEIEKQVKTLLGRTTP